MGREIKRVPLDFDWPLKKTWAGFLSPERLHEKECPDCGGRGYSPHARDLHELWYGNLPFHPAMTGSRPVTAETPAVRAFAERNVAHAPDYYGTGESAIVREGTRLAKLWNGMWQHHLSQEDVDALVANDQLRELTSHFVKGEGWVKNEPAVKPTAQQVNEWSLGGNILTGLSSTDCYVAIKARCERDGYRDECATCNGHGSLEAYPGQRQEAEDWEPEQPPAGEGWQMWETVSEGSPVSPVFATPEELADWMTGPDADQFSRASSREGALKFIKAGWAPSFIGVGDTLMSGVEAAEVLD